MSAMTLNIMNKFLWFPSFSLDFWTLLPLGQDPFLQIPQMIGQYLSKSTILAFSSSRCQHSTSDNDPCLQFL